MASITQDVQGLDLGAIVDMYTLDLTEIGGQLQDVLHFHPGVNGVEDDLVWQGQRYGRYPVESSGYQLSGKGVLPRPQITVGNIEGVITFMCILYNDMVGAKITRKRTLGKYLDAVNFPGGVNPSANPGIHFADEVWYVNRKVEATASQITFELTAKWDVVGVRLPRGQMLQNACMWRYRGPECSYAGTLYFDINDNVVTSPSQDRCGKRLTSCKLRFGATAELPTGAFPGMFRLPTVS